MKNTQRILKLLSASKGKKVLDMGCVDHNIKREISNKWLHKRIASVAKEIVGLDYDSKNVEILNKKGYNMVCEDAENFNLNKKFDVIIAGELIEHLMNAGNFLESVKKHMHKDSVLILTTPNAFGIRRILGSLITGRLSENSEHVSYYSDTTLYQLLKRKGFTRVKIEYVDLGDSKRWRAFIEKILNLFTRKSNRMVLFVSAKL